MQVDHLAQHIESLIFISEQAISFRDMKDCLETTFECKFKDEEIIEAIELVKEKFQQKEFAFEVVEIADGYQFLTKGAYHKTVATYLRQTTKRRLSRAALETLSIIAYKQPVTKSEMEKIRGVSCDYSIQKLLEKELVSIEGRASTPGKPLIYATSDKFMDYFGLKSIDDLPRIKDFKTPENEVGEMAPIEETIAHELEEANHTANIITEEIKEEILIKEEVVSPDINEEISLEQDLPTDEIKAEVAIEMKAEEELPEIKLEEE